MENLEISKNKIIGCDHPTFIIAEIGQNHQGDLEMAKKLIEVAKECGADCAKFQKTDLKMKFNRAALKREYRSEHSWGTTYGEHKEYLEFSEEEFRVLKKHAETIGILFTASAMDETSLDFLCEIQVPFIKIGSGDANNLRLIERAATKKLPLIISTGMQSMETVRKIYSTLKKHTSSFVLMHCVSSYPTPINELNLSTITTFKNEFPSIHIGYSGHEIGNSLTPIAVALGAKVIERHLTLDKRQKGSDHRCSLEPDEFAELVSKIREVEMSLGDGRKRFVPSERACYEKLGKSVVAGRDLISGDVLKREDLIVKVAVPKGIDGCRTDEIVGSVLKRDVKEDESILDEDLIRK